MLILHQGKIKPFTDNWYWRCPKCHAIGYHETDDKYTEGCSDGWLAFKCPVCGQQIRNDRYFNRFIAWLLFQIYYIK